MMNALTSQPLPLASLSSPQISVLQPKGCLGHSTDATLQTTVEALFDQGVHTVVVDLIWVTQVTADGIQMLSALMDLAFSLSKELVIWSANAETYTALNQERDRLSSSPTTARTETVNPHFNEFLSHRIASSKPSYPIAAPPLTKPVCVVPILAADPYTTEHWQSSSQVGVVA